MTRLQKKCMIFSLGLHGLLAVILLASAGFSDNAPPMDLQVLTMIPANIVDRAGSGGGTPVVNLTPLPPAQPKPQPQSQPLPQPPPQPQTVQTEKVERVQIATPPQRKETARPPPAPDDSKNLALESKPQPPKPSSRHEIHPTFTEANAATSARKTEKSPSSASLARAEARRLKAIENTLAELASGVRSSGSPNTIVDLEGIGGGAAFAGYRDVVYSYYYRAWTTPESTASRSDSADAKVTIGRDGSIISAVLVRPSGNSALDKSVERALREVTKLPPFPASTRDTQRTFSLRFSPEAKEMTG
jgi:TonB family protein